MRGVIAAVAVLVLVAVVVFAGGGGQTPPSSNPNPAKTGGSGGGDETLMPVKRVLECESPTTMNAKTPDGSKEVFSMHTISEGKEVTYLEIESNFIHTCG